MRQKITFNLEKIFELRNIYVFPVYIFVLNLIKKSLSLFCLTLVNFFEIAFIIFDLMLESEPVRLAVTGF